MTRPIRIALIGKSGSGKSRAGELLSRYHGIRHLKTGSTCRQISNLLFGNEDKRSTQLLDDALTQIDPSIFLRAALRSTTEQESFILDALRFTEDVKIAEAESCILVRILAPEKLRLSRLDARGQVFNINIDGNHRSETELDSVSVDFEIVNDGDITALEGALLSIASKR